jgi:hypothetical protein
MVCEGFSFFLFCLFLLVGSRAAEPRVELERDFRISLLFRLSGIFRFWVEGFWMDDAC